MTPIPGLMGFPPLNSGRFIDALKNAGLATAPTLALCLDFGDRDCTNSLTPQALTDLSGADYTFANGQLSSTSLFDMQWNGTPGSLSKNEFFKNTSSATGEGGSQQLRAGKANPMWVASGHWNNAAFCVGGWFWLEAAAQGTIFATSEIFWTNAPGWAFVTMGAAGLGFYGRPGGSGSQQPIATTAQAVSRNAWHFLAMSVEEATGSVWFQVDGAVQLVGPGAFTFTDTTGGPDSLMCVGTNTRGHWSLGLNARIGAVFGWSGTLPSAKMAQVYQVTRERYA